MNIKDPQVQEEILTQHLAMLSGSGHSMRSRAGRSGTEQAAQKLETYSCMHTLTLQATREDAMAYTGYCLQKHPHLKQVLSDNGPQLSAVVGSGFFHLNPAILCIEFQQMDALCTMLHISAFAKEGLIKQKSSEKACAQFTNILLRQK